MLARLTHKLGLRLAVALIAMAALVTRAAGTARVDFDQGDTGKPSFVADELLKLEEAPTVQVVSSTALNLYLFRYPGQLLNTDTEPVAFGSLDNGFTDDVVRGPPEMSFTTGEFFEFALSRAGAALLQTLTQTLTQTAVLTAYSFNLSAAIRRAEAVGCNLGNAKVYAQIAVHVFRRRFRHLTRRKEVERAARINEVAFALLKLKPFELTSAGAVKHLLSAFKRPDRHAERIRLPPEDAAVTGDSAVRSERALGPLVQIRVGDLRLNPNHHLARQPEALFRLVVGEFVEGELPPGLRTPNNFRNVVARLIRPFEGSKERPMLFRSRQQLNFGRQLHPSIRAHFQAVESLPAPVLAHGPNFLPRLKARVSISELR